MAIEPWRVRSRRLHRTRPGALGVPISTGVFSRLTRRVLGGNRSTLVVIAGLAASTLLVGAGASVVRAAIMGSLNLLAAHLNRQNDGLVAASALAFLMSALEPNVLFDLGFSSVSLPRSA